MDPEAPPSNFSEFAKYMANMFAEFTESHRSSIENINARLDKLSPSKDTENSFTPIRETSRGESLLNITDNFDSPVAAKDRPKLPINSRATFGTNRSSEATPIFQSIPKHDHLKPKDLSPMEVYQFVQQVTQFSHQHKVEVYQAWCLTDVQAKMVAQAAGMRLEDFRNLDNRECELKLRDYVAPKSVNDFIGILDTVHFSISANMRSTSATFRDIYDAFILYSESFRNLYNFLDSNQNPKIMPNVDKKPKGVLTIYLSKLPPSFADLFYGHMCQDRWFEWYDENNPTKKTSPEAKNDPNVASSNRKKLNAFIKEFEKRAKFHKEIYDSYKPVEDIVVKFPEEYEKLKAKRQVLNKLVEVSEEAGSELNKLTEAYQTAPKKVYFNTQENFPRVCATPTIVRPCFAKFQNGECKVTNCVHDHSDAAMKLLRDKGNSFWSKLNVIEERVEEPIGEGSFETNDFASPDKLTMLKEMEPTELDSIQEALSIFAVGEVGSPIVAGKLILSNKHSWEVDDILLDTGALQRNYIDPDVLNDIEMKLNDSRQFKLVPVRRNINAAVELGDATTIRRITQSVILTIAIPDADGSISIAREELQIFKTGHPMIIGRPAICRSFIKPLMDGLTGRFGNQTLEASSLLTMNASLEADEVITPGTILPPFEDLIDDAPEEESCEHPQSFSYATDYLDRDMNEMIAEYLSKVEARIPLEYRDNLKLRCLLEVKGVLVFVPQNWDGLRGVTAIDIQLVPGAPKSMKPKARFIPLKILPMAKKEFMRLLRYLYIVSTSCYASPIVIAPKASDPFVRICGDYREFNLHILRHYGYIPRIFDEIAKIIGFSLFTGLDMKNAFHQCPITEATSDYLSIVTPWGQFRPKFLPEGVSVASITLQDIMREIFKDDEEKGIKFTDFVIVIFDNLLILAHDVNDMLAKLEQVFDKCIEHNMFLNVSKSDFCVTEIEFFGYLCSKNSYRLNEAKFDSIRTLEMPNDLKAMRSFLGTAVFFQPFVPNFVHYAAPFYLTTRKEFKWPMNEETMVDLNSKFLEFIEVLMHALRLFYPDFSCQWIMRCDASIYGWSAILLQIRSTESGEEPRIELISCASGRFSAAAGRWETIKQECYAIYMGIYKFKNLLTGKSFLIQTDHNNLRWMASSENAMIIRWRLFIQNFDCQIEHIQGKSNVFADYLSRASQLNRLLYLNHDVNDDLDEENVRKYGMNTRSMIGVANLLLLCDLDVSLGDTSTIVDEGGRGSEATIVLGEGTRNDPVRFENNLMLMEDRADMEKMEASSEVANRDYIKEMFNLVHNARAGHFGAHRTKRILDQMFPKNKIPLKYLQELADTCPECQMERQNTNQHLSGVYRSIKQHDVNSALGVDFLTITPTDEKGHIGMFVVVNMFSKLVFLYPVVVKNAVTCATAIFKNICTYGFVRNLYSDPGSENTAQVMEELCKLLGMQHRISIVNRHESNGVERPNKEILRHLRHLVQQERVKHKWADDTVLPVVQFIINSTYNRDSGTYSQNFSAFTLTFGNLCHERFDPNTLHNANYKTDFVAKLNANFQALHTASKVYQEELAAKRLVKHNNPDLLSWGDLVVRDPNKPFRKAKLNYYYRGPYEVRSIINNNVELKHLAMTALITEHVERLKPFLGTREEAEHLANLDADQFFIRKIKFYLGDPEPNKITSLEIVVEFEDEDVYFLQCDKEITETQCFIAYAEINRELFWLTIDSPLRRNYFKAINSTVVPKYVVGYTAYTKLRFWGFHWFEGLSLPKLMCTDDPEIPKDYICAYVIVKKSANSRRFNIKIPSISNAVYGMNLFWFSAYGYIEHFDPAKHELVDENLTINYPAIVEISTQGGVM